MKLYQRHFPCCSKRCVERKTETFKLRESEGSYGVRRNKLADEDRDSLGNFHPG